MENEKTLHVDKLQSAQELSHKQQLSLTWAKALVALLEADATGNAILIADAESALESACLSSKWHKHYSALIRRNHRDYLTMEQWKAAAFALLQGEVTDQEVRDLSGWPMYDPMSGLL
jgi:hypothetical protein